jgi:hypothetical protein
MIKRLVNKSHLPPSSSNSLMQIKDHQSPPFVKTSPAAETVTQNTTPKKKSSPFNMDKLIRKFFNKPTVEVIPAAAPTQPTVFKNESFGLDSIEIEQSNSNERARNRTVSCGRQKSDFVVEHAATSFSSLTVSPQVDVDLNEIKMR